MTMRTLSKTSICILFLMISMKAFSWNEINYRTVEEATYRLYMQKEWKALIDTGNIALDHGIDYYYLRMRIGIAHYELKQFRASIPHFKKALIFNEDDATAKEYLYYSFLFSGMDKEAKSLAREMDQETLTQNEISSVFFENIGVFSGYSFIHNPDKFDLKKKYDETTHYLEQSLVDRSYFMELLIRGNPVSKFHLTAGVNRLGITRHQQVLARNYYVLNDYFEFHHENTTQQNQFFLSSRFFPDYTSFFDFSVNLLNLSYEYTRFSLVDNFNWDYQKTKDEENDYALWLAYTKQTPLFSFSGSLAHSALNEKTQWQPGLTATWYPKMNPELSFSSEFLMQFQNHENENEMSSFFSLSATKMIFRNCWAEILFSTGEINNFTSGNGMIIYNDTDLLRKKAGINLYYIFKKLNIFIGYSMIEKQSSLINYSQLPEQVTEIVRTTEEINYSLHKISGGITWKF